MNNVILLGIFTGNHAGAEASFEAGEYTIGSGLECDVALTDSTLAPRHCSFSLAEDGTVRLSPLEGTLILDGESMSAPLNWPARTPILAGMVCLAWTRPGQDWAGLKLPSLLAAEEGPSGTKTENRDPGAEDTDEKGRAEPPANPEMALENTPRPANERFGRWAVILAVVLALAGLTISLSPFDNQSKTRLKKLEQVLRSEGFSDLWAEENAGRVMIYGLVPTGVDANKIRGIAAGQPYPVQVIVREREEFSSAILTALAGHGLFPQLRIEDGEALLLGYALDSLTENAALSWARGAVPRVVPIRSALLTRGVVEETLTAELAKADLTGKTSVDWRPGSIALSGETADKNALAEVIEVVRGALGSPIAFQLAIDSEPEKIYVGDGAAVGNSASEFLPGQNYAPGQGSLGNPFGESLSLRSVTRVQPDGTGLPFITTSDGAVYFLGGTLPSGHTLTGIYADRLEFSRNGSTMAYKLQGR
ncbi:MAG: type III secretion system inner membrane ring subunit SctD [Desulfovibrionaceae bacterium]|nr:type III secretion system inner membrane ring subunit SctD [Desulfovibrionaceae bacterium]